MGEDDRTILVLGATGQQGGSVATALIGDGWRVRALVRDPGGARARALSASGAEVVRGDLADTASVRAATAGAYGVFSVQPSSGQPVHGVTDEDEVRFGVAVADAARDAGVEHLVYSSASAAGARTGVGHFDSKLLVEEHVRGLPVDSTVVRPTTFMEILLMPDFGLGQANLTFLMRRDQPMQFVAVEDIGRIVARIFADRAAYRGRTFEIAGDRVTGDDLAAKFTRAAGRAVAYRRFPDSVLAGNELLRKLAGLVDEGPLAGAADLDALRRMHPGLLTFDAWLRGPGRAATRALFASGGVGDGPDATRRS